jgi:hypothetical protein
VLLGNAPWLVVWCGCGERIVKRGVLEVRG